MKRLSLQWRITLLTILLLAAACVTMKTLLCSSGHAYMDSIGNYVMHYAEEEPLAIRVDIPEEQWKDMSERFSGEFVVELSGAKHSFCMRGWYIALAVTVLGGAVAYFVSGRALKPLKRFTAKAERVQLQSLTEITLSEDEAAEFSRLSRAVNRMLLRLKQAFDAQQQFVGNAAHELRTPLTLLQTQLELFPDEHPDIPPESAAFLAALQDEGPEIQRVAYLAAGQYLLLRQAIAVRRLVGPAQAAIEAVVAAIACKFNDAPEKDLRSEPSDGNLPSKRHRRIGAVLPMHQQKRPLLRGQAMRPLQRLQQLFALHISHSFA